MALSAGQIMEYGEKKALSSITGSVQSAVTTYLALVTAAPASGADLTMAAYAASEFSTSDGYARQPYSAGTPTSAAPSVISNNVTITYGPITTAAPGTAIWAILTDALTGTGGNVIASYLLANPRTPLVGDSLTAASGAFTISFTT
ncbi:MAG: hypothetical protein ACLP7J_03290 [Streptosporangiaceae bacterium]